MSSPPARELGRFERLCYERDERDQALAKTGHPKGFWFDQTAGDYAVRWFEKYCRHHKGEWAGRPLLLERWQKWILSRIFGWKRPDGTRRFRKAWIELPRKNGKTQIGGGTGLFLLVGDNEPGAEVYTTATAKEQALICHEAARGMVRVSPKLAEVVHVPKSKHANIVCDRLGSKMQILSSDYGTLDGLSPHGDIRDEVHAWTDHELAAVLNTAMGARRQPLTLEITTAGTYDAEGVGWQHHEYATQVIEGDFEDDRLFVYIAAIDEKDDPWDPASWSKANPNLGVSLKMDFIAEQATEARRRPTLANDFLRLHCNRWVQQVTRWLNVDAWRECGDEALDERALRESVCFGGLDLSRTTDLTAFVLIFELPNDVIALLPTFWLPEAKLEEEQQKKGQGRYRDWAERGFIQTTPGNVVDYNFVRRTINEQAAKFPKLREIGFDPYNAVQMATDLISDGLPMVEVRQGPPSLSEACKYFEGRILERKVRHAGHPVLGWCVGNAVARKDANDNIAPDKKRAKEKIDGVSATVTGLARFVRALVGPRNPYEDRGFIQLGGADEAADDSA